MAKWLLGDFTQTQSVESNERMNQAENLIEKLKEYDQTTSTTAKNTIDTKREIIADLLALSKYPETHEILGQGIPSFLHSLRVHRSDVDILRDSLEFLTEIIKPKTTSPPLVASPTSSNSSPSDDVRYFIYYLLFLYYLFIYFFICFIKKYILT